MNRWPDLRRDARAIGWALLVSLALGVAVDRFRAEPLALVYRSKPERLEDALRRAGFAEPAGGRPEASGRALTLREFEAVVRSGRGVVVDARPAAFYELGHVPGALNLPREDFARAYAALRRRLGPLTGGKRIVVYCSDVDCRDSGLVQGALLALGYSHVDRFPGGWEEWTGAGNEPISAERR